MNDRIKMLSRIMNGLLRERECLTLQVQYAHDDDMLDQVLDSYFYTPEPLSEEDLTDLARYIQVLVSSVPDPSEINACTVQSIFECTIEDANAAFAKAFPEFC